MNDQHRKSLLTGWNGLIIIILVFVLAGFSLSQVFDPFYVWLGMSVIPAGFLSWTVTNPPTDPARYVAQVGNLLGRLHPWLKRQRNIWLLGGGLILYCYAMMYVNR